MGVPVAESTQVTYYFLCSTASTAPCCPLQAKANEDYSNYEVQRDKKKAANEAVLELMEIVKVGMVVHIPATIFPEEEAPADGYWVGKTVSTRAGGAADIGIRVGSEPVFTRPRSEVLHWIVRDE